MIAITSVFNWLIKNPIAIVGLVLFLAIGYIKVQHNTIVKERNAKVIAQSNFSNLAKGTEVWQTRAGNYAARVGELKLTVDQIKNSNIKEVTNLYNHINDLDIKLKNVSTLASNYAEIIDKFKVKVIHDTIVNGVTYHEWERYTSPYLQVTRHLIKIDSAEYDYNYHNTLYYYIVNGKEGKWKLKNIFCPRPITNKLYITSEDKKYRIDSLQLINKVK